MIENYGITKKIESLGEIQRIKESVSLKGYYVVSNAFDLEKTKQLSEALNNILVMQEKMFSKSDLIAMREEDIVRMPFSYDPLFFDIIKYPLVRQVVESLLGDYYILHLQNGIINRPSKIHHQVSWHRDLPYQDFVSSEPLGINAFLCLDEFTVSSGATFLLPFSHKIAYFPSEAYIDENRIQLIASPGSILFFDSMLYHKAGINTGDFIRRGINTMFVRPILKQQIDIPELLQGRYFEDPVLRKILGYDSAVAKNVEEFRRKRIEKGRK